MVWANEFKKCAYCGEELSIWEGVTEAGKWYHEPCNIHNLGKKIDAYKKKWIDNKLSPGDKIILLDLYNLWQTSIAERTEYKGFQLVGETTLTRNMLTDTPSKEMVSIQIGNIEGNTYPVLENGKPVFVADKTPTIDMKIPKMRPVVVKKEGIKRKLIGMKDLPRVLGIVEE